MQYPRCSSGSNCHCTFCFFPSLAWLFCHTRLTSSSLGWASAPVQSIAGDSFCLSTYSDKKQRCTRLALGCKTRPDTHETISSLSGLTHSKPKALHRPTLLLVLPSVARAWGENTPMDITTSEEPLWVPSGMCRWIKWGKLTSKTVLQSPMCKEALKNPGCCWKGRRNTAVVVKGQPTLAFHSQRTGLLSKENTACRFSSRNLDTAKHQKAKRRGKCCNTRG